MPTRHRTPTSTYQNRNIDRVSNRDLQKWKACQERRCRNVNKQERYQPPPPQHPPTHPTPPHPNPPHPHPTPHPPEQTLACRQPNYHRKHVTKHSKKQQKMQRSTRKPCKTCNEMSDSKNDANLKKRQHSATPSRGLYQKLTLRRACTLRRTCTRECRHSRGVTRLV